MISVSLVATLRFQTMEEAIEMIEKATKVQ